MKTLDEKRDELADDWFEDDFKAGWDACAKEYEKENAELKKQLEIALCTKK